jgi:hypothetical protein
MARSRACHLRVRQVAPLRAGVMIEPNTLKIITNLLEISTLSATVAKKLR